MQLLGQVLSTLPAGLLIPSGVSLTRVTLPVLQVLFFSLIHMVSLQHALLAQWCFGRHADVCCPLQLFNGYSESSIVVGCVGQRCLARWPAGLKYVLCSAFCCTIGTASILFAAWRGAACLCLALVIAGPSSP